MVIHHSERKHAMEYVTPASKSYGIIRIGLGAVLLLLSGCCCW